MSAGLRIPTAAGSSSRSLRRCGHFSGVVGVASPTWTRSPRPASTCQRGQRAVNAGGVVSSQVGSQGAQRVVNGIRAEEELAGWMTSLSNWGRWGADDQLGALNFISPGVVTRAPALGAAWSSGQRGPSVDLHGRARGERCPATRASNAGDPQAGAGGHEPAIPVHRRLRHHGVPLPLRHALDSLSRCSWNGKLYNGHTAASESGAAIEDIGVARADIVTRGILIDVPFLRGYSADGGGIGLADLGRAEAACGIRPEERDLLLLRAGLLPPPVGPAV